MKWTTGGVIALSALVSIGATDIRAQPDVEGPQVLPMRRGPGIEAILQMRERLELTDDQIASLDALRREAVERRSAHRAELAEMRSRLAAGQIQRSAMMAFMEERRAEAEDVRAQEQARVEALLTEAQLESLQEIRTRGRAFVRGRAAMRRGGRVMRGGRWPGVRGGRDMWRGPRGFDRGPRRGFRGMRRPGRAIGMDIAPGEDVGSR
jgi:hypothetical protein